MQRRLYKSYSYLIIFARIYETFDFRITRNDETISTIVLLLPNRMIFIVKYVFVMTQHSTEHTHTHTLPFYWFKWWQCKLNFICLFKRIALSGLHLCGWICTQTHDTSVSSNFDNVFHSKFVNCAFVHHRTYLSQPGYHLSLYMARLSLDIIVSACASAYAFVGTSTL